MSVLSNNIFIKNIMKIINFLPKHGKQQFIAVTDNICKHQHLVFWFLMNDN